MSEDNPPQDEPPQSAPKKRSNLRRQFAGKLQEAKKNVKLVQEKIETTIQDNTSNNHAPIQIDNLNRTESIVNPPKSITERFNSFPNQYMFSSETDMQKLKFFQMELEMQQKMVNQLTEKLKIQEATILRLNTELRNALYDLDSEKKSCELLQNYVRKLESENLFNQNRNSSTLPIVLIFQTGFWIVIIILIFWVIIRSYFFNLVINSPAS